MGVGERERVEGVAADGLDGLVLCVAEDALGVHAPELADGVDAVALVADHGHGAVVLCDDYCGALVSLLLSELDWDCLVVSDIDANIIVNATHAININIYIAIIAIIAIIIITIHIHIIIYICIYIYCICIYICIVYIIIIIIIVVV